MAWDNITDLPPTNLYEDEHGNVRRKIAINGRFIAGTWPPAYGQWGYGEMITLDAWVS